MANLNRVLLIGNCTRDVELKYTPQGTPLAELGLAINRIWKDTNGERKEDTTFVDVTLWGRNGEIAAQYLKKGKPVFIEGRLNLDSWDDKQTGQKRTKLKVIGETIQLLGAREEGAAPHPGPEPRPEPRPAATRPPARNEYNEPEDIPF